MTFLTQIVRFLLSVWRSQAVTSLDSWESTRDVAMQTISTNFDKGISWFDTHYRVVIGVRSLYIAAYKQGLKRHWAAQSSTSLPRKSCVNVPPPVQQEPKTNSHKKTNIWRWHVRDLFLVLLCRVYLEYYNGKFGEQGWVFSLTSWSKINNTGENSMHKIEHFLKVMHPEKCKWTKISLFQHHTQNTRKSSM